jgi:hypothetical protein
MKKRISLAFLFLLLTAPGSAFENPVDQGPELANGNYGITIEVFDVNGNRGSWTGKVRVFAGEADLVPSTAPFATPVSISPLQAQAAGQPVKVTMVYNLTAPADIDLQIYSQAGPLVWARRFPRNTAGGMAGYNAVDWDGRDAWGRSVGNGVYAFRIVRSGKVLGTNFIIVSD